MLRSGLVTFILSLLFGVQSFAQGQLSTAAPKKEDRRFTAEWRVGLIARDKSNIESQSKFVDFKLDINSEYRLNSSLILDIQPTFRLQAGQSQSVDGADKAENKILLHQAAVHYTPFNNLKFSAGALNQEIMHTSLLMDDLAFPGARITSLFKVGEWITGFAVESAIPTSTSLSTNTNELEATPSLNTASFRLNFGSRKTFHWKNTFSYFAYSNLPSAVAKDSNYLGNEVIQVTASDYHFAYQFQGLEARSVGIFPIAQAFDLKLGAEYLQNQKAPSDLNSAYQIGAGGDIHINKDYDLSGFFSYYSVAPEAAVSYFNAKEFETNRIGYAAEGFLSFLKDGFRLGLRYSDAEVMFNDRDQSRQKSIFVKLETFYADI